MSVIRWGILGGGRITQKFTSDLCNNPDAELYAVASRSAKNSSLYKERNPSVKLYDNYEAMLQDPAVDIVYVATPHGLHYQHVLQCLKHNKHVLCEKAFAINAHQATEMIAMAKDKGLFLMEGLWSKFTPPYMAFKQIIEEEKLGKITAVLIQFGFIPQPPVADRIFDPNLGGGTLLDIGIYNILYAVTALGYPDEVDAIMVPSTSGVDRQLSVLFRYNSGAVAQLFSTFCANLDSFADIAGTNARLRLTNRFYNPETSLQLFEGISKEPVPISVTPTTGFGFEYEIAHVHQCLAEGLTESKVHSHNDTLQLMQLLDRIRKQAGLMYPADTI